MELDGESEDEEAKLRKAAVDAMQALTKHCQKKALTQNLELVDLVSSDEDLENQVHPQSAAQSTPFTGKQTTH